MSIISPRTSPVSFKSPSIIFRKQEEELIIVKRQRDELVQLLHIFNQSSEVIKKKMEETSIFNAEITRNIGKVFQKMINLNELNTLFEYANKWEQPILNNLIKTQVQSKNDNQFVVMAMSNELKMINCILLENANHLDYSPLKYYLSPFGIRMFQKIAQLRTFQRLFEDLNYGLKLFHLPKLMEGKIMVEQECKRISQLPVVQMNKTIIQVLEEKVKQFRYLNAQLNATIVKLKDQKLQEKARTRQAEQANSKLADQLFILNKGKAQSSSLQRQYKQTTSVLQIQKDKSLQENKSLKTQLQKQRRQKEISIDKYKQAQSKFSMLAKQNQRLNESIKQKQTALSQERLIFQRSQDQKVKQLKQLKMTLQKMQEQNRSLKDLKKQKSNDQWQKNEQIVSYKKKIEQQQQKLKDMESKQKEAISQINISQLSQMESTIKRHQAQIARLTKDAQIAKDMKERQLKKLRQKDEQINEIQSQYNSVVRILQQRDQLQKSSSQHPSNGQVQKSYQQLIRTHQQLQRIHGQLQTAYRQLSNKYDQLSNTIMLKNAILQQKQAQIKELKQSYNNLQAKSNNYYKELTQNIKKIQENNAKLIVQGQKIRSMNGNNSLIRINSLFQNDVLDDYIQHKKFLTETIQSHMRMTIVKTRLVYAYDPQNRVNFHKYIDGVQNIVIIIKLKNGTFVAGYSQGAFQQFKTSDREGLIIALSKKKYFTLIERNRRAISYDDYYIIFGNSQLRIRSQENVLFSNFGISNSYYSSKNERVNVILGGGPQEREVEFDHYEIYQLTVDI